MNKKSSKEIFTCRLFYKTYCVDDVPINFVRIRSWQVELIIFESFSYHCTSIIRIKKRVVFESNVVEHSNEHKLILLKT